MKYQYFIFQYNYDYYKLLAENIGNNEYISFVNGLCDSKSKIIAKLFGRYLNSNKRFFDKLWYPHLFSRKVDKSKPVCFIIFAGYANFVNNGYGKYLRKKYPGCKLVCRFTDKIEKMPYKNFYDYKDSFDLLQTYDIVDAQKYNIDCYQNWYTEIDVGFSKQTQNSDVFFIGRAKDRLGDILDIYEKLKELGLTCDFNIVDALPTEQKFSEEINYCCYMPYTEVLQHVKSTKCILEIAQKDEISETLRAMESLFYNKKLITNNQFVQNREYFDKDKIYILPKDNSIDKSFFVSNQIFFDNTYRKPYSIMSFLNNLEQKL